MPGALPNINVPAKPGHKYMTLIAFLMHPISTGSVHIKSNDFLTPPIIDPRYLSRKHDTDVLLLGVKLAMKVAQTSPLSDCVISPISPSETDITDEDLRAYCKQNLATQWHPIGTAAMVPREKGGVVDGRCVVYGTANLRVVSYSMLPQVHC